MKLKIGSRKSRLALWQSRCIANLLRQAHDDIDVEIVTMLTTGDRRGDEPLPSIGAKGLFTAELEQALLKDDIDLAVHSLKDLPSTLPEGLEYAGSPERASATDAFISLEFDSVEDLPEGATVATGSQRRRSQLLHHRPDLEMVNLRGNIDTRLAKLESQGHGAIIMATAALERLEMPERITAELDPTQYVPAISQGAMGIETRIGRDDVAEILAPILDDTTVAAVSAERSFMRRLEGGCSVALGAYCRRAGVGGWSFFGWASSTDGSDVLHDHKTGADPKKLADDMAQDFLDRGARDLLHS